MGHPSLSRFAPRARVGFLKQAYAIAICSWIMITAADVDPSLLAWLQLSAAVWQSGSLAAAVDREKGQYGPYGP